MNLSKREQDVYNLIVEGLTGSEIAQALFVTEGTVKFHKENIFKKLKVGNVPKLIVQHYKSQIGIPDVKYVFERDTLPGKALKY